MKPLVIDTSVAVKWLNQIGEFYLKQADKILENVQTKKVYLVMPELAKYEIGNALLNKKMGGNKTSAALKLYFRTPIRFVPQDESQAQDAMKISLENNITFYDASFIALAKVQNASLITDNPRHQKKNIKNLQVVALKDYGK